MADEDSATLGDVMAEALASAETATPTPPPTEEAGSGEPKIDGLGRSYATGRRKNAVARVWI